MLRFFADLRGTMVNWTFSADRLLGLLCQTMGQPELAVAHFEDALAFCRKAGYRPELAWSCYDYADFLLDSPTSSRLSTWEIRQKAVSLLDEALATSTELGMLPLKQRATERLERIQAQPSTAPAYPDGLTQREVEILRLVAAGKTDREIADELVIGVRTVSTHVGNILNKINAANRAEATGYAVREGLA